jgi:hypothetical protein
MTATLETHPARSASLTTSQWKSVQLVWDIAGLPPTSGYAATLLALAVASDDSLAVTLTTVDFDEAEWGANAVDTLVEWRQRTFSATS